MPLGCDLGEGEVAMELNQFRVFYYVAKCKSFAQAADALFVTRPAVSIKIRQLEDFYGVRLFERSGKKIELTNAGKILFAYAEKVFNLIDEAESRLNDMNWRFSGVLRISTGLTVGTCYLGALINAFREEYPEVEIQMQVKNKKGVIEDILNSWEDLGFLCNVPINENLVVTPLGKEELVVIASPSHPFGEGPTVSISQLNGQSFILREKGSGTREYIERQINKLRISINICMEIGSDEAIKRAVMEGLGISIVPIGIAEKEIDDGLLRHYYLREGKLLLEYSMVHHKDKYISGLIQSFMQMATDRFPLLNKKSIKSFEDPSSEPL